MKAIIAILFAAVAASAQSLESLKMANQALTNVMQTLRPAMAANRNSIPWTHDETPDNGGPLNLPPGWLVASNAVRQIGVPMRLAVWTFDAPGGSTWGLVAEAHIGSRSNIFRRIVWPEQRLTTDIPEDWQEQATLLRP